MSALFRPEVLQARADHLHGEIIIGRPFSSWLFVAGATAISIVILTYLIFGTYTKRTTVTGLLEPAQGAIRIQPPTPGTITERRVGEGQSVKKGDVIFILSDERGSVEARGNTRLSDLREDSLQKRRISLKQAIGAEHILQGQSQQEIKGRLQSLKEELDRNKQEIELQNRRVESAVRMLDRHEVMAKEGFISELALQEKVDQVSTQHAQFFTLQRQHDQLTRNIASTESELESSPNRSTTKIAELERELAVLDQEAAEMETRDRFAITAPADGIITAITAQLGQMANGQAIAILLPKDGEIVAHLFAPSRAIGFIKVGQKVRLRYQAYPYQKYGQYEGRVVEVSRNPIQPSDVPAIAQMPQEGMYRIVVKLNAKSLRIDGKRVDLLPGMVIDADVEQEKRRLIEWMIEPIYTLSNRMG